MSARRETPPESGAALDAWLVETTIISRQQNRERRGVFGLGALRLDIC